MKFFRVENNANRGEIYVYGDITDFKWFDEDVTPKEMKTELDKLKGVDEIHLYVNSPGGGVFAGMAIHSMLKRFEAKIIAHVDGLAASIASVIIMAADEIHMPKNALIMIHNPAAGAFGEADEMRKIADALDKVKTSIVETYMNRVDTTEEEVRQLMDEETWFTGEEAVALGFADVLEEELAMAARFEGEEAVINGEKMKISDFKRFPRENLENKKENDTENALEAPVSAPQIVDFSVFEGVLAVNRNKINSIRRLKNGLA